MTFWRASLLLLLIPTMKSNGALALVLVQGTKWSRTWVTEHAVRGVLSSKLRAIFEQQAQSFQEAFRSQNTRNCRACLLEQMNKNLVETQVHQSNRLLPAMKRTKDLFHFKVFFQLDGVPVADKNRGNPKQTYFSGHPAAVPHF